MTQRVVIYEGFCHRCDTRVLVSQPESRVLELVRAERATASTGRGVCPVCAKTITWKPRTVARRKGLLS